MLASFNRDSRISALELSLRKLGVEELNKDDVQRMQWEHLKSKIGNWNQSMQIAVRVFRKLSFNFTWLDIKVSN